MFDQENIVQKVTIGAEIILTDGTALKGCFFASQGQRLVDLFNDQRTFIPFSDTDGTVQLIRKSTIVRIVPVDQTVPGKKGKPPGWFGG